MDPSSNDVFAANEPQGGRHWCQWKASKAFVEQQGISKLNFWRAMVSGSRLCCISMLDGHGQSQSGRDGGANAMASIVLSHQQHGLVFFDRTVAIENHDGDDSAIIVRRQFEYARSPRFVAGWFAIGKDDSAKAFSVEKLLGFRDPFLLLAHGASFLDFSAAILAFPHIFDMYRAWNERAPESNR